LLEILSITNDNLIFQHLTKILGFPSKVNFILKNSIFKRNKSEVWSAEILEKLFKAMITVPPTSIISMKNILKSYFEETIEFLSKIIPRL
jgi:hypothetical protein